jgi:hypothetical protein
MIGTPSYDGKLNAQYVDSLLQTLYLASSRKDEVFPIFLCYDALLQRSRNDLFQMAYESEVDYLFFIDSDMSWKPEDFFKLVDSKEDFILATGCKKVDELTYTIKILPESKLEDEIIEIEGGGCAFMRLSKNVISKIWGNSEEYNEPHKKGKMIFNISIVDGELVSEDISFCNNWRMLKGKIYLDSSINLNHYGNKTYTGDFRSFLNYFIQKNQSEKENIE